MTDGRPELDGRAQRRRKPMKDSRPQIALSDADGHATDVDVLGTAGRVNLPLHPGGCPVSKPVSAPTLRCRWARQTTCRRWTSRRSSNPPRSSQPARTRSRTGLIPAGREDEGDEDRRAHYPVSVDRAWATPADLAPALATGRHGLAHPPPLRPSSAAVPGVIVQSRHGQWCQDKVQDDEDRPATRCACLTERGP